jgi:hypothetical protein
MGMSKYAHCCQCADCKELRESADRQHHRGIGRGSQYCTDNDCRCQSYERGTGPYLHYTFDAGAKPNA